MRLLATDAIVLHTFDYRETSRIVRLATREAGIVSAIARGARRPKSKFGSALDLFTGGVAQLSWHPTGDLHTLTAFDAGRARPHLAASLAQFGAAEAFAEVCLRFGGEDESGRLYTVAESALDRIGDAPPPRVAEAALAGLWHLVGELGFAPSLELCASCHAPLDPNGSATFHHRAGGALCPACARRANGGRVIPARERATIVQWLEGAPAPVAEAASVRAHQRLLREFLETHLGDGRPLRAFLSWEAMRP